MQYGAQTVHVQARHAAQNATTANKTNYRSMITYPGEIAPTHSHAMGASCHAVCVQIQIQIQQAMIVSYPAECPGKHVHK